MKRARFFEEHHVVLIISQIRQTHLVPELMLHYAARKYCAVSLYD